MSERDDERMITILKAINRARSKGEMIDFYKRYDADVVYTDAPISAIAVRVVGWDKDRTPLLDWYGMSHVLAGTVYVILDKSIPSMEERLEKCTYWTALYPYKRTQLTNNEARSLWHLLNGVENRG